MYRNLKIIVNKNEIGAGTRGARLAFDALEIAALNKNNNLFNRYEKQEVANQNQALYLEIETPYAKRIKSFFEVVKSSKNIVEQTYLKDNSFPIVISGDHSCSAGTVTGIRTSYPEKRLGIVWIDAHADLHSPYTTPSGNMHGMPLGMLIGDDNLDEQINPVDELTKKYWDELKSLGGIYPKVNSTDVLFFGVRDTEQPEDILMESKGIKNYSVEESRYRGLDSCINEAVESLDACDIIYLSFDVDSLDADQISKGTGTPVSNGFDAEEVQKIIKGFLDTKKVCCFEIVEINPTLDNKGNKMAEHAFNILNDTTNLIERIYVDKGQENNPSNDEK